MDQHVGARALHLLAIEPRDKREPSRIGNLVGGDDPRPERARADEILAGGERIFGEVTHGRVAEAGIAGDIRQRIGGLHVPAGLADDERKLAFEIEIGRDLGADHVAFVRHERVHEAQENVRQLGRLGAVLGSVRFVVDADAHDLFGIGDRG